MPIKIRCPNPACGKSASISDDHVGRTLRCGHCGAKFTAAESIEKPGSSGAGVKARPSTEIGKDRASTAHGVSPGHDPAADDHRKSAASKGVGDGPKQIGRFQIRARVGAGAFGTVFRAYDPQLDREVALKVPHTGSLDSSKAVERFLREAKAAAQLRHPHIVPIYDAGRDGEHYYIASAFIDGRTLADAIDEGPIDFRHAAEIVRQLAEALAYAHSLGIVHRDVKPANVMLDEKAQAHVMDFGLAHRHDSAEKLTHEGTILGTPAYMAPEQAVGKSGEPDPASDQYSLGVVLYELLCGNTPFSGPPSVLLYNAIHQPPPAPRSMKPQIPRDLETICLKALSKSSHDRFASCQELADDLRRYLDDSPILARRLGPVERTVRWCRRKPMVAGLTGAVAMLLIAVAIGSLLTAGRERALRTEADKARANATDKAEKETKARQREAEARAEAEKARIAADEARDRADKEAKRARRHLYAAHMNLAQNAWEDARVGAVLDLLARQRPKPGEDDLRGFEWYYWQRLSHPYRLNLKGHTNWVQSVAFSPDGQRVASASADQTVKVWDAATGQESLTLKGHTGAVKSVAFSPDGQRLASASMDQTVRLWDAATGQESLTLNDTSPGPKRGV